MFGLEAQGDWADFKGSTNQTKIDAIGFFTPTNFAIDSANTTRWGGTVGTGVEIGFAPGWSVAFEYNHLFMGSSNNTFAMPVGGLIPGFATRGERISEDVDMGTVRINYTFGGPVVARY